MNTTTETWLASLKAGDKVATYHNMAGYHLHMVARRTPSGRIVLTDGNQFDKSGREISSQKWGRDQLLEVTPKVVDEIARQKLVTQVSMQLTRVDNINTLRLMSTEALEAIAAVLTKYASEE